MSLFQKPTQSHKELEFLRQQNHEFQKMFQNQPEPPTEPFVGWRVWGESKGKLYSLTRSEVAWPFRKALQADDPNWHTDSTPNGIHAVRLRKQILSSMYPQAILGTVNLWGRVVKYTEGFRAEFAYPKALYVNRDFDIFKIMELEENYGVPVEFAEDLATQAQYDALNAAQMAQFQQMAAQQAAMLANVTSITQTFTVPQTALTVQSPTMWGYQGQSLITGITGI